MNRLPAYPSLQSGLFRCDWRPHALLRYLFVAGLAAVLPTRLLATTADTLCRPTDNPCRVTTTVTVTPGSVIDVGDRQLLIAGQGGLNLVSGMMTLRAAELRVDPNANLRARGSATVPGGKIVVIAGTITIDGDIDASGAPGGAVTLTSMGPLTLSGLLDVRSRASDSDGGTADLQGTDVTITGSGRINALGGGQDFGGAINIVATGNLLVSGGITSAGGDGGGIDLSASQSITISASVTLDADATAAGGSGGDITVSAIDNLVMDGILSATGRNGTEDTGGGDGGTIAVDGATIMATRPMSSMTAAAGGPDGVGGDIDVTSTIGDIDLRGHLAASSAGVDGTGGEIGIDAAGAVSLSGGCDASGGGDSGGDVSVSSGGVLTVNMGASLDTSASAAGSGGDIDLSSADSVSVVGSLTADGGASVGGSGGTNTLSGCSVRVENTGRLSSLRNGGSNVLIGRDVSVVSGTLRADPTGGQNVIRFAGPAYEPSILPGAQINPDITLVEDSTIVPCNPVDTPTPSTEPPTPTATPGPCVGDCDGNGEVSVSDLIVGVNIALGNQPIENCLAFDVDGSGTVDIGELIQGVNNALDGCPAG
jgi:hypothetical protein